MVLVVTDVQVLEQTPCGHRDGVEVAAGVDVHAGVEMVAGVEVVFHGLVGEAVVVSPGHHSF